MEGQLMALPYYPRYPRDFLEGTVGLGFELKAAYGLLLDLIYMKDGRLPDVEKFIAGHLEVSVRRWNGFRAELIRLGKIEITDGFIRNYRSDKETETSRKYQNKQRENRSNPNKNKELQTPQEPPRGNQSESQSDIIDKSIIKKKNEKSIFSKEFEIFWKEYPNKNDRKPALEKFLKVREHYTLEHIMAGLAHYKKTKEDWKAWKLGATFLNKESFNFDPADVAEPASVFIGCDDIINSETNSPIGPDSAQWNKFRAVIVNNNKEIEVLFKTWINSNTISSIDFSKKILSVKSGLAFSRLNGGESISYGLRANGWKVELVNVRKAA